MKVLVTAKRVIDFNVRPRVRPDGSGIDLAATKMSMNPFDEIAIEEAVRLKEKGVAREIVAVSIGREVQDVLRTALAMGVDRALNLVSETDLQPLAVAKLLRAVVLEEGPQLVIMGKQAIDGDNNAVGQMLAGLLDWPQATFASRLEILGGVARVTREVEGAVQTLEVDLPAVVTAELRLNEPRYASLPNIMRARSKPVVTKNAADYGIDLLPRLDVLAVSEPPQRKAGVILASAAELAARLRATGLI